MEPEIEKVSHGISITDPASTVSIFEDVNPGEYNIENVLSLIRRALLGLGYDPDLVNERIIVKE